jgi:transposase
MRYFGLDVHKAFIQVCAIDDAGQKLQEFRIAATAEGIGAFSSRLGEEDEVVLEATFHSWAIWALLAPHAGRAVVANPLQVKAIAHARVKTDKVDAHMLAQLLRTRFIPEVEMPDAATWALRELVSHRRFLGRQRVALRNRVASLVNGRLYHCPWESLFGAAGRKWLAQQEFSEEERLILTSTLRLHDQVEMELKDLDQKLRGCASQMLPAKLLITIPGVNVAVAVGFVSAIGDVKRFESPKKLASYFGLVPRVSQSADRCYHGHITKAGRSQGRWLAIEAAQSLSVSDSPLAATYHRVRRKKGHNVAVTALARKLVVLTWHLLTGSQPYHYAPVARTRHKLRRVTTAARPAARGQVPGTLEAVYAEACLPLPGPRSEGERRAAASNRRVVTAAKKRSPSRATAPGSNRHVSTIGDAGTKSSTRVSP